MLLQSTGDVNQINPLPANHDNSRYQSVLLAESITVIEDKMAV